MTFETPTRVGAAAAFLMSLLWTHAEGGTIQGSLAVEPQKVPTRPHSEGQPTEVAVGVYVIDIGDIDDASQSFEADLYFSATWMDERLADPGVVGARRFALSDVWHPYLELLNQRGVQSFLPERVEVDPQGNVQYLQRAFGRLSAPMDFHDFPFDRQILPITLISVRYGPKDVALSIDPPGTGRADTLTVVGWNLELGQAKSTPRYVAPAQRSFSQISIPMFATRNHVYYRWTIGVPLMFIVFMAWGVFWIDPTYLPSQIGVSTASVFSLIAFRFAMRGLLPAVGYMTRGDFFLLGCTILVFLAFGQAVLTGRLAKSGRETLARSLDRWGRWVYLLGVGVVWILRFPWRPD